MSATVALALMAITLSLRAAPVNYTPPPETVRFKPGPGSELATTHCSLCHSADYISTQPVMSRAFWKASVEKMRKVHGAPIPENIIDQLADYLAKNYGDEMPGRKK
ncbi:MAG: cytochrome c [Verrucomicrobiota bacterium]